MTVTVDIDERIEKCRKILDMDPNSQIFAALAEAYRKKGELDKAFRICQSGLRIHPSYGSAHIVMAKINLDRGLYDWAEAEVQQAIDVDGRSRAIELLLAEIYIYKGEYDQATRLLKQLSQSDPENAQIKRLLEIAKKLPEERQQMERIASKPASTPSPAPADEEVKVASEPAALTAPELLAEAITIPSMTGVMLINGEGLVVESEWRASTDASTCGAVMAEVKSFLHQELLDASFGAVQTVLIETGDSVFYVLTVGDNVFVFVGDGDMNLGTLRMRIGGLMERFQGE